MKIPLLFFLLLPSFILAQNLVPNGSFEIHSLCPDNFNEVSYSTGWSTCVENNDGIHATDYCNACGTGGFSVPVNVWGSQYASDGVAYMSLATTATDIYTNYRENIKTKLVSPLIKGKMYYGSFKVSKSDITINATNKLGLKFSTNGSFKVNNISQISEASIISDTSGWTMISGSFIADSAYQYVAVGNFYDDAHTTIQNVCNACSRVETEYYIDNIIVRGIAIGPNKTICEGDTTHLSVTGGDSYLWSPSTGLSCITCSNPIANPTITTTYIATTMIDTVIFLDTEIVNVVTPPSLSIPPVVSICPGQSIKINPSSGFTTYIWSPSAGLSCSNCQNPVASPPNTTLYKVIASINGCSVSDSVKVTVNKAFKTRELDTVICIGSSLQLNATAGDSSYSWSPSAGLSCTSCPNPLASPTVNTTYYLTSTNNNCTIVDSVIIIKAPVINAGPDTSLCQYGSVQLSASGNGNYNWSPAVGLSSTAVANPVAHPVQTTTYTVTNTLCNTASDSVVVTVIPRPVISYLTPNSTICTGGTIRLVVSNNDNYAWSPHEGLSCTGCQLPYASPTVTTTYYVTLYNQRCSSSDSVVITVVPHPPFYATGDTTICAGRSAQLHAYNKDTYLWLPPSNYNDTIPNPVVTPIFTTTYLVAGTNVCGVETDTVVVVVVQPPSLTISPDTSVCKGQKVQLSAQGGVTYKWSPGEPLNNDTASNPTALANVSTTYTVVAYSIPGCSSSATMQVKAISFPDIELTPVANVICGTNVPLNPVIDNYSSFHWKAAPGISDTTKLNPTIIPEVSGTTYTLIASNQGCDTSANVIINILEGYIDLPKAFSPNHDGHNDKFHILYSCGFTLDYFMIYNRWGQEVFSTQNIDEGWDGTYNGIGAPIGVYVYVLNGHRDNGEKVFMKGNVTLLR